MVLIRPWSWWVHAWHGWAAYSMVVCAHPPATTTPQPPALGDSRSNSQVVDRVLQLLPFSCCRLQLLLEVLHLLLQCQLLRLCLQQSPLAAVALIIRATQLLLEAVVAAGIIGGKVKTRKRSTTRKSQRLLSMCQGTVGRALGLIMPLSTARDTWPINDRVWSNTALAALCYDCQQLMVALDRNRSVTNSYSKELHHIRHPVHK